MAQNAVTPQQTTTIAQKAEIVAGAALFFATPVLIFLRKKPGYRFLNPIRILVNFLLLGILGVFSGASGSGTMIAVFTGFAWAMLITGLVKRHLRWNEIKGGLAWHTYSRGVSWFSFVFPWSDSTIKRWVDPVAVLIIGIVMVFICSWFGLYLIFAAFCLLLFSAWDYEQAINRMLDTLDSMVDSEVMSGNVEYYSQPGTEQRPIEQTAGIPTGVAPDIEVQIQRRRRSQQAAPDNLATGIV